MITEIVRTLSDPENLATLLDAALAIILAIGDGLINSLPDLATSLLEIISNIVEFFTNDEQRQKIIDTAWELGKKLAEGIWEGVKSMASWVKEKLFSWFDTLVDDVKEDQEIHSPSRKWARVLGKPMGQGVGVGAVEGLDEAEKLIQSEMDNMTANVTADVSSSYSGSMKTPTDQTNELLSEMINLFKSGKAKTNISNARDLRGVSYG
jgi:phage-related protein